MITPVTLGYSPCPNDTYIFYALTHGLLTIPDVQLASPMLEDVETLNSWAVQKNSISPSSPFMLWGMCSMSIVYFLPALHSAVAAGHFL